MAGSPGATAASLTIAPPELRAAEGGGTEEVERLAVHDGSVDRQYMAKLESEAGSGTQRARFNAAVGHHAAALFEFSRGDTEHALTDERTAISYAPEEPALLMNAAYICLQRSEYKQALEYLERARRYAPDNPDVAKLTGWSYYGLNKLDEAIAEWKRALTLRPEKEVRDALERAERDKKEEESYRENESSHFKLRYNGTAAPALARDVLRTLEMHFSAIESELNFTPPESIGVILYTQDAFSDITRAPSWVGALNDGRIRVPVQGLSGVDQELSHVLKHELTHSFVRQKTRGNCLVAANCGNRVPTWVNEGLAQWMSGEMRLRWCKSLARGMPFHWAGWKAPGWVWTAAQHTMPTRGRSPISNTSFKRTAWAMSNASWTGSAPAWPRRRRCAKCCTAITTT